MYNQITLIGNIGNDATLRFTPNGTPVCAFNLAVNRNFVNKKGEKQTSTLWVRVTLWQKAAQNLAEYLLKGERVMVVGELNAPQVYTDKAGKPAASLEITGQTIRFLGNRKATENQPESETAEGQPEPQAEIPF